MTLMPAAFRAAASSGPIWPVSATRRRGLVAERPSARLPQARADVSGRNARWCATLSMKLLPGQNARPRPQPHQRTIHAPAVPPPSARRKRKTRSSWHRDSSPRRWPPTPAPCFPPFHAPFAGRTPPSRSSAGGDPGAKDSRRRISPRGGSSPSMARRRTPSQKPGIFSRHFHSVSGFSWIARGAHKTENPPEMLLMSRQRSQPALETTQPQRGDGVHPAGRAGIGKIPSSLPERRPFPYS